MLEFLATLRRELIKYGPGPGVAICVRNDITHETLVLPDFDAINAVALKTTTLEFDFTFVSVYAPAKEEERKGGFSTTEEVCEGQRELCYRGRL